MTGFLDLQVGDRVASPVTDTAIFTDGVPRWFALRVAAQREEQAEAWLARRGVYAFHPVTKRRSVIKGRVREYHRRYLPGYVFARFPGAPVVHKVMACPFVIGALALSGGAWGVLDPRDLQAIHAMRKVDEAAAVARRDAKRRRRVSLRPGDAAMFSAGVFSEMRCEVVGLKADGGVVVRVALFGGDVLAKTSADDLITIKKQD